MTIEKLARFIVDDFTFESRGSEIYQIQVEAEIKKIKSNRVIEAGAGEEPPYYGRLVCIEVED